MSTRDERRIDRLKKLARQRRFDRAYQEWEEELVAREEERDCGDADERGQDGLANRHRP